jgi:hypothetical protein
VSSSPDRRPDRDRGLAAVERVREVRERDSRLGLRDAAEEHRARELAAERLDETVRRQDAAGLDQMGLAEFAGRRRAVLALAGAAREAHRNARAAARLKAAADEHWQRDRARLRAVQHLLELRAEAWQAEAARTVARELDDIGTRLWLRNRGDAR